MAFEAVLLENGHIFLKEAVPGSATVEPVLPRLKRTSHIAARERIEGRRSLKENRFGWMRSTKLWARSD